MTPDPVTIYARRVQAGDQVAGPHVRATCARHLADLVEAPGRGWTFDLERVRHVFDFFAEILKLNGGEFEDAPFELAEWEQFIVGSVFGWVNEAGDRRYRTAFVEASKGSGKSPLAAGIGLYMMIADGEPRAEVYAAAAKKDQALVMFRDAVAMVKQSPGLRAQVRITGGGNPWNVSWGDSFFRPISSDGRQSGPRPSCALVDEVHEHHDDSCIELLRAGFKFRRQPLLFLITNSGSDRESVCWRYHSHAVAVASGDLEDDRFFSYVCALDEGDEPFTDESCWPKANPGLGITIKAPYLRDQVREAKQMPAKESTVRRLNFCQWTDAASPWISSEAWRACEIDSELELEAFFKGAEVMLSLDLSSTTDLTALGIAGEVNGRLRAMVELWTPEDTMQARAERDGAPYPLWARQGHLRTTPGKTLSYAAIAKRIVEIIERIPVQSLVFDRYRMAYMRRELEALGMMAPLVEHPQGFVKPANATLWMPQSVTELERAVLERHIDIKRNPVLTWCAASAVVSIDLAENRIFSKRKSTGRIDGLVALAMAVGAVRAPWQQLDIAAMIG